MSHSHPHFHPSAEDYTTFLEAGFIAVNQADEDSALKLFRAAEALRPNESLPKVGFGYLHLHKLELKQAIAIFESIVHKEPENEMAKSLLGICMSMSPTQTTKGEKLLHETTHSRNPLIQKLSHTAIDFVERFVKKSPGPAGKGKL